MKSKRITYKFEELLGKSVAIGITKVDYEGNVTEQQQFVGRFKSMDHSIHVRLKNGRDFKLPPDLRAFQKAKPGVYRFSSTGEEVENPDFTTSWTVRATAPKPTKKRPRKKA